MRILFLTHYFPPEGNAPATRVHALARHWVRAGHQVDVITGAPNVPNGIVYDGYRNRLAYRESIDGIRVLRVWTHMAANAGFARRIANYLSFMVTGTIAALFARRPDLVIATSPQLFCGWSGAIVAKLRRLPFLLEIRDIWPESIVAVGAMRVSPAIRFLEWMAKRLYATADRIVAVGNGYRRELEERGVPSSKIDVIPNGIDSEVFSPRDPDPEVRKRWGLGDDFVCAYVGTVGMAAGLDVVLRAAAVLRAREESGIRFLIVGDGAERERLQEQAAAAGMPEITFTGRLDKSEIPGVLAVSDCCLIHLRKQRLFKTVLPSKLFEAAAMAKPVILGIRGEAQVLLNDLGGGLSIEPESETELADAVLSLAQDPKLAQSFGAQAFQVTSKKFARENLAAQYLSVIDATLAATSGHLFSATGTGERP